MKKIGRNPFPNGYYSDGGRNTMIKKLIKIYSTLDCHKSYGKNKAEKVAVEGVSKKTFWVKPELDGERREFQKKSAVSTEATRCHMLCIFEELKED